MIAVVALSYFALAGASLYDPHVPKSSPWFEGWYTRISESTSGVSIGAIVGYYPDPSPLSDPAAYVALIVDQGHGEALTFTAYPKEVSVLARGAPVAQDPEKNTPANFSFIAGDSLVELRQEGDVQVLKMNFADEGVSFEATLDHPEPWDEIGEGPEGWAGILPFVGLHWFVYSLHSSASFKVTGPKLGTIVGTGSAHQEKNWGTTFPTSWIWGEAINADGARLALAGGALPIGPVTVPNAFLVGYRSAKLNWNFHPQDPAVFQQNIDACAGTLELFATSALRKLRVIMTIEPMSSAGLFKVGGPTKTGFRSDSVESYRTNVTVEAWSGLWHDQLEERLEFTNGALEFGGEARCGPTRAAVGPVAEGEWRQEAVVPARVLIPTEAPVRLTPQRVRRELRTLSPEERERVFAAMDVMKATGGPEGRARFGPRFAAYDELVAQHLAAAAQPGCDEAHLGPAFATYHRAFTLRFEEALLAVDPQIGALPYWDYNIEARLPDPRRSELWTWFGSSEGDPADGHAVKDGRFAHWRVRANASDISAFTNSFGLLRSPWNINPSPYITRYRYACGSETTFEESAWELCTKAPLFLGWYACIDPSVHTWAHSFIGGVWDTERNVSRIECFMTNAIGIPTIWQNGCLECSQGCTDPASAQKSCACRRSWSLGCLPSIYLAKQAPTYGDFADAWTSPNDPIFFFHHANVDRNLMLWQQQHHTKAPDYGFPTSSIPCHGHGLNDVVAPHEPFDRMLLGSAQDGSITNADLMAIDGLSSTSPYTYDTMEAGFLI